MSDFNELNVGPRWYIAHTYTGYENKVKATIERVVANRNLSDVIFDVKIPVTTSTTVDSKGKEKIVEEKIYPSYVFVKMVMNDETWHIIRNISGVTGFVGPGSRPVPLTDEEALSIAVEEQVKLDAFKIGDEVEIIDGFLTGHKGTVSEISEDASEVTVIVSTIGREMPVNMDAKAIKKV
ncbi:MAG: transcription termination/antitermination factor NusG [Clostridia bacterium]|nr:transcription termination/antitermination factor NusG [Clostridia bacterium]